MTFQDKITITQYRIRRLLLTQDESGDIFAEFELMLFNADGEVRGHESATVALSGGERTSLLQFINSKRQVFENNTGLTYYPVPDPL